MTAGQMPEPSRLTLIYVPCGTDDTAASIARSLLAEGLIACANIFPSHSIYIWEGRVADEQEYVLVCKTAPSRAAAAIKRIEQLHTYAVPCIITMEPAAVNYAFTSWVSAVVAGTERLPAHVAEVSA